MLKDFLKNSVSYGLVNVIQKACDYLVNIVSLILEDFYNHFISKQF